MAPGLTGSRLPGCGVSVRAGKMAQCSMTSLLYKRGNEAVHVRDNNDWYHMNNERTLRQGKGHGALNQYLKGK